MRHEERELLEGMRNCFRVCGDDFDGTIRMVSSARGRDQDEVKKVLVEIATKYENSTEYRKLRYQIPKEFPF